MFVKYLHLLSFVYLFCSVERWTMAFVLQCKKPLASRSLNVLDYRCLTNTRTFCSVHWWLESWRVDSWLHIPFQVVQLDSGKTRVEMYNTRNTFNKSRIRVKSRIHTPINFRHSIGLLCLFSYIRFEPARSLFWPWVRNIKLISQKEFKDSDGRNCCKYIPKEFCVWNVSLLCCICFPQINARYLLPQPIFPTAYICVKTKNLAFIILKETNINPLFLAPLAYTLCVKSPHPLHIGGNKNRWLSFEACLRLVFKVFSNDLWRICFGPKY